MLFATTAYNWFMVLYSIALDYDFSGWIFYTIDLLAVSVYLIDIFIRANTAISSARDYCLDKQKVIFYYINYWLLPDLICAIPIEYAFLAFAID